MPTLAHAFQPLRETFFLRLPPILQFSTSLLTCRVKYVVAHLIFSLAWPLVFFVPSLSLPFVFLPDFSCHTGLISRTIVTSFITALARGCRLELGCCLSGVRRLYLSLYLFIACMYVLISCTVWQRTTHCTPLVHDGPERVRTIHNTT